jgi:chromosome segregation ATPase
MSEELKNGGSAEVESTTTEETKTPSIEELQRRLAEQQKLNEILTARNATLKSNLDSKMKDLGNVTKQLRQRMTAEEQAASEAEEAKRAEKEKMEAMEAELNRLKASNAYTSISSDEETINTLIEAVGDNDHKSVANIIDNIVNARVKEAQAEWLKSRPDVSTGGGDRVITKEEFDNMGPVEKTALKRQNPEEYQRLRNL